VAAPRADGSRASQELYRPSVRAAAPQSAAQARRADRPVANAPRRDAQDRGRPRQAQPARPAAPRSASIAGLTALATEVPPALWRCSDGPNPAKPGDPIPQHSAAFLRSVPSSTSASASIRRATVLSFSARAALRSSAAVKSSRVIATAAPSMLLLLQRAASIQKFPDLGIPIMSQPPRPLV